MLLGDERSGVFPEHASLVPGVKGSLEPKALRELWAADESAVRDIYVPNTSIDSWKLALDAVTSRWPSHYSEDGVPMPMPSSASEIFNRVADRTVYLEIELSEHLDMSSYFFESH